MLSCLFCQVWDADVSTLVVEEVEEGSAASRSGLVDVDDIVCEVDGINVTGQPLDVVESLMRGKAVSPASINLHKQTTWSVFLSHKEPPMMTSCVLDAGVSPENGVDARARGGRQRARNRHHSCSRASQVEGHHQTKARWCGHHLRDGEKWIVPAKSADCLLDLTRPLPVEKRQDAVDNSAKVKSLIRGSPADASGLIKPGDVSGLAPLA